jgi:hypothetical protein
MEEHEHVASNTQLFILGLAHLPETFLKSGARELKTLSGYNLRPVL